MDFHLNKKTMESLCFKREDFMTEEFSVDKFVSEYRKYVSLESIREDMNILHKKLCTAMVELINDDYIAFVNLSSNLVGLDKSITDLTLPLKNLRNEVDQIKKNQIKIFDALHNMFEEKASNHASKVLMFHVLTVFEGLQKIEELGNDNSLEALERRAFALYLVQFHMTKITEADVLKDFAVNSEAVKKISESVDRELESVFLESFLTKNSKDLEKVLRICAVISSESKLEYCFQCKVVRPYMKRVISQSNITKKGFLKQIYHDILSFVPKCSDILKITSSRHAHVSQSEEHIPGYDFLVNAVWPEIINSFEYISEVYVYSIGDPVLFRENYTATMDFLCEFERLCQFQSSVKRLRQHSSYSKFKSKWNLNVYFEIRYGEIARILEEKSEDFFKNNLSDGPYMLTFTSSLHTCLECCCNSYLPPLKSSFCKLFFQLISRYKKVADSNLMTVEDSNLSAPVAMVIKDVEFLVSEVNIMFSESVFPKFSNEFEKDCLTVAFNEAIKSLEDIPRSAGKLVVKLLTEKCSSQLKMIANIPQRYRKTNREIPSKPSPYVSEVLTPLIKFKEETNFLSVDWRKYCDQEVIDGIMKRCIVCMKDVLTAIKKMEDSLKILKRAKPTGQFSSGVVTDDDKIRRQLAIDVNYFEELILKGNLETSNLKTLKELKELVKSAERIS